MTLFVGEIDNLECQIVNKNYNQNIQSNEILLVQSESKKILTRWVGCGIRSLWPIIKTGISIYQSNANFDEKILLVKSLSCKT